MLRTSKQDKIAKKKKLGTDGWLGSAWVRTTLLGMLCLMGTGLPVVYGSEVQIETITEEEALQLGEDFGVIVGEVDEEIQEVLGLTRAEGVVVFEVIGGKPAELAGIKSGTLIKEINSVDIKTLKDFGMALKTALPIENFSVATYAPADLATQGIVGGINFHFVRVEKS